jgi:ADP-ribose pyrophosphatase YjhB (NUDIX family)
VFHYNPGDFPLKERDKMETEVPLWLKWARELQSLSQTGLTYSEDEYHAQRYRRLAEIAAEIIQGHTSLDAEPILASFRVQLGYATPKVDVRGAVIRHGKILLVQERSDRRWCMPGGWADVGELPSEMVAREVWEESGFTVVARRLIGVYDANRSGIPIEFYHAYKMVFLCEIVGGAARPSNETLAVDFFGFDAVPPLSAERTDTRHLGDVYAHLADPDCPAAFD